MFPAFWGHAWPILPPVHAPSPTLPVLKVHAWNPWQACLAMALLFPPQESSPMHAPSPTVPSFPLHAARPIQLSFDTWPALKKHAASPRQAPTPTLPVFFSHAPGVMLASRLLWQAFLLMLPELSEQAWKPVHAPGCRPPVLPVQASVPIQAPAGGAASGPDGESRKAIRRSNATTPLRTGLDMRASSRPAAGAEAVVKQHASTGPREPASRSASYRPARRPGR